MPSPHDELWRLFASPVPTHTTFGSVGLIATSPIDTVVCESKTFSHVLPPLVVFKQAAGRRRRIEDGGVGLVDREVGDATAHEDGPDVTARDGVEDRVRYLGEDGRSGEQEDQQQNGAANEHKHLSGRTEATA